MPPLLPIEDLPGEEWRAVVGNSVYEVSNTGRLRRASGELRRPGLLLKQRTTPFGYSVIAITRRRPMFVHRIVAIAFIGPPPTPKHQINHIDGVKANNRRENLEWVTAAENKAHALRLGLATLVRGKGGRLVSRSA